MDPGRPHSPSLNASRTRPEAEEFALKNKGTNDWFRHDGKNAESPLPPPSRAGSKTAKAIAGKYKGDSEDWYVHSGQQNGAVNGHYEAPKPQRPPPVNRCHTPDAWNNFQKIKGTEEAWYKHDDNKNFISPRPKSRLQGNDATEAKGKSVGSGSEWYKHEHKDTNGYTPQHAKIRLGSANAKENQGRLRPAGTPVWASYDPNGQDATDEPRSQSRMHSHQAIDNQEKNNKGSATNWFGHSANGNSEEMISPRRGSEEGQQYAEKQKGESGNWFNHDANKNYTDPTKPARCRSASAREMVEKTRGHELERVMNPSEEYNQNGFADMRIKPEAAEFAQKSVNGMMSKYLHQESNGDYHSARPAVRIKPEGAANAAKNRGNMDEFMEGYLDSPRKHGQRRIRPEAEEFASRNRGTSSKVITGDVPTTPRKHPRVTGDAAKYADRNQGTSNMIGSFDALQVTGTPIKHRSKEAAANAARWQGTEMSSIFNH